MNDTSRPTVSESPPWQFSIKSLMMLMCGCACVFGLYRLLLPHWPRSWPHVTAALFSLWSGGIGLQVTALVGSWLTFPLVTGDEYRGQRRELRTAAIWGTISLFAWLTLVVALWTRPSEFDFGELWTAIFGIAALHLLPAGLGLTFQHCRRVYRNRARIWLQAAYVSVAGNLLLPAAVSMFYLLRRWLA